MPSLSLSAGSPASFSIEKGWSGPCSSLTFGHQSNCNPTDGRTANGIPQPGKPLEGQQKDLPLRLPQRELPRLHVVTVATHGDGYFTSLLYSSALLQTGLRVLGWGEKWKGFGMKPIKLVEYCRRVPPQDVVMLVDGFDTVILQPNEVIVSKFLEFGGRVVLTGESCSKSTLAAVGLMFHNCVFKSSVSRHWPKLLPYANRDVNARLLNSGGLIGYAVDLICLLEKFQYSWNDQRYLSEIFMREPHKKITIDSNCSIFGLYRGRKHFNFLSYEEAAKQAHHVVPYLPGDPKWSEEAAKKRTPAPNFQRSPLRGVVMDAISHETPCVLHMYCRGNADWLMRRLGLPDAEQAWNICSLVWYALFSLYGTLLHVSQGGTIALRRQYVIAFFSAVVGGVGVLGLVLNTLVYFGNILSETPLYLQMRQDTAAMLDLRKLPINGNNNITSTTEEGKERERQEPLQSGAFMALQLFLVLLQLLGGALQGPCTVLVHFIVRMLPVFVALTVVGVSVLGVMLHVEGGFGDEDEDKEANIYAADTARGAVHSGKGEKR